MQERRSFNRVKIPGDSKLFCRITEPINSSDAEFLVNDINMNGLSFLSSQKIEPGTVKLFIKFPSGSPDDPTSVRAKVVYCNRASSDQAYRVGVSYL